MATKQDKTPARREEAQEQAVEAPQVTSEAAAPGKPRTTAPVAPRVTSGTSYAVIARVRDLLAGGLYKKHPQALEEAVQAIEAVSTIKAHAAVGVYKAEVLDYLRGKIAQRDSK